MLVSSPTPTPAWVSIFQIHRLQLEESVQRRTKKGTPGLFKGSLNTRDEV